MLPILSAGRWTAAAILLFGWLALCAAIGWRERQRRRREAAQARQLGGESSSAPLLVAHASQTGTAEALAWQTGEALRAAGLPTRVTSLATLDAESLGSADRVLIVTSTYGEGDPPDSAAPFARRVMARADLGLGELRYAILALGDRTYANFCGFGRTLDDWFRDQGAQPLFERIDVDNGDTAAIAIWHRQLIDLAGSGAGAGTDGGAGWTAAAFARWRLRERRLLNPGSAGNPVWQLDFVPASKATPADWQAGDLFQVRVPAEPGRPREYSIATVPTEGRISLLVRLARRSDGSDGAASGWLTTGIAVDEEITARIRPHPGFRLGDNAARPLLLIGNGTGIAGLRALIKARASLRPVAKSAAPADLRTWLIFGERQARVDAFLDADLQAWQRSGVLTRCDRVYSRDQAQRRYVQHRLAETVDDWRHWLDEGAAIYVCGSLDGMASGVEQVLVDTLGRDRLDQLISEGRYRRDVY